MYPSVAPIAMPMTVGNQDDEQSERQRNVEPVGEPHEHVAAPVVGAERMLPRRRVRRRPRQVEERLVRTVRVGRHQHPVALVRVRELLSSEPDSSARRTPPGRTSKRDRTATSGNRYSPLVPDDERAVVHQERQNERDDVRRRDEQKRPVATLDSPELSKAPPENRFATAWRAADGTPLLELERGNRCLGRLFGDRIGRRSVRHLKRMRGSTMA